MNLGDWIQLELVVGVVDIPSRRSGFVVGLMVSAYSMLNARDEVSGGSLRWSFSVVFVTRLMGQV